MIRLICIFILLLSVFTVLGQTSYQIHSKRTYSKYPTEGLSPDTINLYDTARSIRYCRYLNQWYFHDCEPIKGDCRLSQQDLFVLNSNWNDSLKKAYYYRYYDENNHLEWEGLLHPKSFMLVGDIHYYEAGRRVRTEHYNMYTYLINNMEYWLHDGPRKDGVWTYYNLNGRVIKKETYGFNYDEIIDYVYPVKYITYYSEEGLIAKDSLVSLPKTPIK